MFGKKKPPKEPDYAKMPALPNSFALFVQAKYCVTPDELHKLFESLGRINPNIKVARRRPIEGKETSKLVGGRKAFMTIAEAVEYEQKRHKSRDEKEEKIHSLVKEIEFDELMVRLAVNDSIYPKHLAPVDIVRSIDAAGIKLDELDQKRKKPPRVYSAREETILDALVRIKRQEPYRVARHISSRQKAYFLTHSLEDLQAEYAEWMRNLRGDPPPETEEEMKARLATEEEQRLEDERLAAEEAARNFGDLPDMHTLLDDVAALIRDNPEAAAAIVRQWIGSNVLLETKT
jgi:hypothetical protein